MVRNFFAIIASQPFRTRNFAKFSTSCFAIETSQFGNEFTELYLCIIGDAPYHKGILSRAKPSKLQVYHSF